MIHVGQTLYREVKYRTGKSDIVECKVTMITEKYFYVDNPSGFKIDKETLEHKNDRFNSVNFKLYTERPKNN